MGRSGRTLASLAMAATGRGRPIAGGLRDDRFFARTGRTIPLRNQWWIRDWNWWRVSDRYGWRNSSEFALVSIVTPG